MVSDVDWSIHWKELTEYFGMKKKIFVIPENKISAVKNSKLRQKNAGFSLYFFTSDSTRLVIWLVLKTSEWD